MKRHPNKERNTNQLQVLVVCCSNLGLAAGAPPSLFTTDMSTEEGATSWPKIQDNNREREEGKPKQTVASDRNTLHNPTKNSPILFMFTLLGATVAVS
jgi:hypothetical protein